MSILSIQELSKKQDSEKRLRDISKNLSFSVALSSGMAYKDKMESFYKVIAKEINELIDSDLLDHLTLYKFHNQYLRVHVQNQNLCFLKNNMIVKESRLTTEDWLDQKLVYLENQELPTTLSSREKSELMASVDQDLEAIIIRNYSRQELNSDRYLLTLREEDRVILSRIFRKYHYYDINVRKYIEIMASNYFYEMSTEEENKQLKIAYNNYILELGLFLANEIDNYLNQGVI